MFPTPNFCDPKPDLSAERYDLSEQHGTQGKSTDHSNLDESRTALFSKTSDWSSLASRKGDLGYGGEAVVLYQP
jgi:hypothetical protein